MTRYILLRVVSAAVVMLGLVTVVFLGNNFVGDPVAMLTDREIDSPEQIEALREQMGYNRPLLARYAEWLGDVATGDLGNSLFNNRPVVTVLTERLPATLILTVSAVLVTLLVSVPLALWGAYHTGKWQDTLVATFGTAFMAVPGFWLAIALIFVFAARLGWVESSGYGQPQHLILPTLALAATSTGYATQVLQSSLRTEFRQQYAAVARAKGLSEWRIAMRHVLPNGALILVTQAGFMLIGLLNGTVLIETIFAWPGIGQVALSAVSSRDLPVLMGSVIYVGFLVTIGALIVDLLYVWLDPRVALT
ncbi:MAG: ABC transporter permease subunit [Dehalococcoidia bacterium]|nr:ABC transporter permease subunit [Dehalococcoidia bacterium]